MEHQWPNEQRDSCEDRVTPIPPRPVSQQHGTSLRIEHYHIILIREMCWKAISSLNNWPSATTKANGIPSLPAKVVSWEITHPKSLDMSSSFKGPRGETGTGGQDGSESERGQGWRGYGRVGGWGMRGASVRDTLGERGPRVTPAPLSQKRGPVKGRPRRPSLLLAATMWSSLASSRFLHRGFVSHANSGSGPNLPGQALHPNWQGARKERGGVAPTGWGARVWLGEEGVGMSPKMPVSFKPLMSRLCPPWESSGGTKAPLSLPSHHLPSALSFFRMNESFRSRGPLWGHNRRRLSQFYAAFPLRGGSLSAGIEGRGDAAATTRGCRSNTLWSWEKGMKGKEEACSHTRSIQTHSLHSWPVQWRGVTWNISRERVSYIFT